MSITLLSSPLQGFTDFRFRNAFNQYFGGIDTFYAPYIRLNGKFKIKPAYERDLLQKKNTVKELIPQIMTNDADEFLFVTKYVQSLGYNELNWNLGCPYPMVTKRGMGSGLICETEKINNILDKVHSESNILVSMKMRLGYDNPEEILNTLPILDNYPLKSIAIHARLGKQLYNGSLDLEGFQKALDKTKHLLYYNGDITSVEAFNKIRDRFPSITHFMIGRGLLSDPFLPSMIKNDMNSYPENHLEIFSKFHDTIYHEYKDYLSGDKHALLKMTSFWEYFATTFENPQKTFKKIKKSKSIVAYEDEVREIFMQHQI